MYIRDRNMACFIKSLIKLVENPLNHTIGIKKFLPQIANIQGNTQMYKLYAMTPFQIRNSACHQQRSDNSNLTNEKDQDQSRYHSEIVTNMQCSKGLAGFKVSEFNDVQNDFTPIEQSEFAHVLQFDKQEMAQEAFCLDDVATVQSLNYYEDYKDSNDFLTDMGYSTASDDSLCYTQIYTLSEEWNNTHRKLSLIHI
eukprot:TRINITY_DN5326_c0_g1_i2.p2 TRINITY_DN5326_c0_g1~~TRINITY_DN5326_c0_g1_i2.p2  ORF type:complete len:197 (+),score=7.31 TRINITY_DN5326_c0_g1_i2:65-655(+)